MRIANSAERALHRRLLRAAGGDLLLVQYVLKRKSRDGRADFGEVKAELTKLSDGKANKKFITP